ncbi:hypothetical protein GDO81_021324 [Engystomops pustulosus]|uniref:C2H2-type domain-containing protein n=1 Tax=Engystomops pustulosus TaxID=76066 RepID=A0AAV6ZJ01_ENGPU|nr:hypothetical protein GDO81_021324 [Engystomops pustulosus]
MSDLTKEGDKDENDIGFNVELLDKGQEKFMMDFHQCKEEESPSDADPDGHSGVNSSEEQIVIFSDYETEDNDVTECSAEKPISPTICPIFPHIDLPSNLLSETRAPFPHFTDFIPHHCPPFKRFKTFPCPECDKCFTWNAELIRHLRSHTGEKPYACSECGKCFTRKSTLFKHQKSHSGEVLFLRFLLF